MKNVYMHKNVFPSIPVVKKIKLQETTNIVIYVECLLKTDIIGRPISYISCYCCLSTGSAIPK